MVITPRYLNGVSNKNFVNATDLRVRIKVSCFGGEHEISFFHEYREGVDWVCPFNLDTCNYILTFLVYAIR